VNDNHHLKRKKKKNLDDKGGCSKNQESYHNSEEETEFYDRTKNCVNETNSDEEKCDISDMETLSAVIQEEQKKNVDLSINIDVVQHKKVYRKNSYFSDEEELID